MAAPSYDVVGIGNAIVDVLARTDEALVQREGLTKGTMALVDMARAEAIYAAMPPGVEKSGGSVANTIAGIASLGGRGAYIGKVRNDTLGGVFAHDLKSLGVRFDTMPATSGPPTARCLILVTPDAQRTMCTFLGACVDLGPEDIDEALIASASVTYLEGYLFDPPRAMEAFRKAAAVAHQAGRQVALSLSDPFCVDRHRADFRDLVDRHVDILFANEREICSLYETEHFELAAEAVRGHCDVAVLTRSERGSNVVTKTDMLHVAPSPVARVVDTTGAGDLYAAGFLYGLTHGRDLATCGKLGSLCAAEIIAHVGARPETSLKRLAESAGLI
ncbi:MAG TPA: adenosine kinase [Stellaceae bacterium]|nr:adenosine kinase [Stellaceae bacterium]HYM02073.1 adenosine kinase [Stellaceae bacterium]